MQTKTFILDAINRLTTVLLLFVFATGPGYLKKKYFSKLKKLKNMSVLCPVEEMKSESCCQDVYSAPLSLCLWSGVEAAVCCCAVIWNQSWMVIIPVWIHAWMCFNQHPSTDDCDPSRSQKIIVGTVIGEFYSTLISIMIPLHPALCVCVLSEAPSGPRVF